MSIFERPFGAFPIADDDQAVFVSTLLDADFPSFEIFVSELRTRPFTLGVIPRFVVLRDEDHAISWLNWYTSLQLDLFKRDLGRADKSISMAITRAKDWSTLSVVYRLSTKGVAGHTQYRIFIRRVSDDLYACRE